MVVEHVFVEHVASATARLVVYEQIIVHPLVTTRHHGTHQAGLAVFAVEGAVEAASGQTVVERHLGIFQPTLTFQVDIDVFKQAVLLFRFLHAVETQPAALAHEGFGDRRGQEGALVHRVLAEEQVHRSPVLYDKEHAAAGEQIDIAAHEIDDLQCRLHLHVTGHTDEQGVLCQCRVERRQTVVGRRGQSAVILGKFAGTGRVVVAQRTDVHPIGQHRMLGHGRGVEHVVHHIVERRPDVGHAATVGLVGVHGEDHPAQVHAVVGGKGLGHVGIFVALHLFRGKAQPSEIVHGFAAQGVHHVRAVLAQQRFGLCIQG